MGSENQASESSALTLFGMSPEKAADNVLALTGKISHKALCIFGIHLFNPLRFWFVAEQCLALFIIRSFLRFFVQIRNIDRSRKIGRNHRRTN